MVKIVGGKELGAVTAASVPNNSIFLDTADNKIKIKNNSGIVSLIAFGNAFPYQQANITISSATNHASGTYICNTLTVNLGQTLTCQGRCIYLCKSAVIAGAISANGQGSAGGGIGVNGTNGIVGAGGGGGYAATTAGGAGELAAGGTGGPAGGGNAAVLHGLSSALMKARIIGLNSIPIFSPTLNYAGAVTTFVGAGGGGGVPYSTGTCGVGGAGGGTIIIVAEDVSLTGTITANAVAGTNATGSGYASGGGGGAGGVIVLHAWKLTGTGTISANGRNGGAGDGYGHGGAGGNGGYIIVTGDAAATPYTEAATLGMGGAGGPLAGFPGGNGVAGIVDYLELI